MQRVSADGLMCSALALRAKCRLSAKCRKRLQFLVRRGGHVAIYAIQTTKNRRRRNVGSGPPAIYPDGQAMPRRHHEPRGAIHMARQNYFNTLTMAQKLDQLGQCRFMDRSEFNGVEKLRGKKVVIVGCGAQGLNQGLNMRDSGLDVSYALRADAIEQKRVSYTNATGNGFKVGTYEELIPSADLVLQPRARQAARRRGDRRSCR